VNKKLYNKDELFLYNKESACLYKCFLIEKYKEHRETASKLRRYKGIVAHDRSHVDDCWQFSETVNSWSSFYAGTA